MIVGTGGALATTVSVAGVLVADPARFAIVQRTCAPLSARLTGPSVSREPVAPGMAVKLGAPAFMRDH